MPTPSSKLFTGDLGKSPEPSNEDVKSEEAKADVAEPASTPQPAAEPSKSAGSSGKTILIAEDERPLSKALELKLTSAGFKVETAFNGEEAVEKALNGKIDLMLLDLVMPKLNGFEVLKKLKESRNSVPIIIVSNLSQEEDIQKTKDLGAIEFFVKSNTPLKQIVEYLLGYFNDKS